MDPLKSEDTAVISDLREQIERLETRLDGVQSHGKANTIPIDVDESSLGAQGVDVDYPTSELNFLPAVRKCNFTQFKNRFSKGDARYAVDVLVSGLLFEQEYLEEQGLRDRLFEHGKSNLGAAKRRAQALVEETKRSNEALRNDQSDSTWIQRIRIQAPTLLQILGKVQGESWSTAPRTYDRPFCTLLHFHPQVKQALAQLEDKWAIQSEGPHLESAGTTPQHVGHEQEEEEDPVDDSQATLAILQSYVDFIDEEVIPVSHSFDNLGYSDDAKILFSDLCYLFKPGDYVYKPLEGEQLGDAGDPRLGNRTWRLFFVNDAIRVSNVKPPDHRKYSSHEPSENDEIYFSLHAYYIEYTGEEFCVVTHTFKIPPHEGWKPISNLPIFPVRFNPNHETYWNNATKIGKLVLHFIESKHAFYSAWTVMRTAQGEFATDANGVVVKHPEYINSEVMVDFVEAFQSCPAWRPTRTILRPEFTNKIVTTDDFTIRWWSGPDRTKVLRETREIIPYRTGVHYLKRNKFILEDPFLAAVSKNHQQGRLTTKEFLDSDERALLYCRVFAYVFRERKFAQLDVTKLTLSERNLDALEALKIPYGYKRLIQGSVRGHFLQKEAEARYSEEGVSLDVIQGKGTGLFILLHGVPGVGKTATAESIALANGKPLFKITCGDIGLTPEQVETSLRAIFRLASLWDCILLMDEVDAFFSQRSKGDLAITKNALVSVFLRVLDYYTGILFLTTNRAGALDEAFKSRIHYKIYYPPLTKEQSLDIWKLNIERLRHINDQNREKRPLEISESTILDFAGLQFDECERQGFGQWNGRQIRNAFQVARSLAYYDAVTKADEIEDTDSTKPPQPAVLEVKYFRMMHDITESFDNYMQEVHSGMNDKALALEMEHRADHWTSDRLYRPGYPRQGFDDRYNGYNRKSSTEGGWYQDPAGRLRDNSHKGSRDLPTVPGASQQRHLPSPFGTPLTAGYDEPRIDDKGSALHQARQRRPSQQFDGPNVDFRGTTMFEGEHAFQRSSTGLGFSSSFGPSEFKHVGRSGGTSSQRREASNQSEFDVNQGFRMEVNEHGKRERL